jgi:hypothetical protein
MKLSGVWALAWILASLQAGGVTNSWWAINPLKTPRPPAIQGNPKTAHPVDAFVQAQCLQHGLTPSPEADRRTLIRRLSFDLIGLPPTPEAVEHFVGNTSAPAYETLVEELLNSPRYGERWARHWMDTAHFAETHGHDQDRIRTHAWPYRDYLIQAFNADTPYPRFVQEQVAGDVLFPERPDVIPALGFLAAGPWDESSLRDIREDTLDRQIARYLDRDDVVTTVMQTFTSTTVQCARCHDHKFDPISQEDYYSLQATFAGVDRASRPYDPDPAVARRRKQIQQDLARVEKRDRELLFSSNSENSLFEWESTRNQNPIQWQVVEPEVFLSAAGAILQRQKDGSLLASGKHGPTDIYTITARPQVSRVSAVRLEVLADDSLPHRGPGREPNGNLHLSEFHLLAFDAASPTGRVVSLQNPSADYSQPDWTIAHALDGNDKSAWGIYPRVGEAHQAVFALSAPLEIRSDTRLVFVLKQLHGGHCIGRPRLSVTDAPSLEGLMLLPEELQTTLATPRSDRTESQRVLLSAWHLKTELDRELASLPPPSFVYAAASDFPPDGSHKPAGAPRPVQVLHRGEITKPGRLASPGSLSCIDSLAGRFPDLPPQDEGARRVALARWLTDRNNPLVWRSIVNRIWHYHFGRGLVETLNDFGSMGGQPSHPELLDWLAVWFRDEAKGSLKQLHRLLVTSQTYKQASAVTSANGSQALDSENRHLSRMNRRRLDAEQVRDALLQMSGQLDLRMGGPSDRQFDLQPGIHVTPRVDYAKFDLDQAAGRRRGVYRFLFRTLPDPFMDALDCPAGDQLTPVRMEGVTVQQALALWNNAFAARQAEHLSSRLEREHPGLQAQIAAAFKLVLNRSPRSGEQAEAVEYATRHGLSNFMRVMINSNEFMFLD